MTIDTDWRRMAEQVALMHHNETGVVPREFWIGKDGEMRRVKTNDMGTITGISKRAKRPVEKITALPKVSYA